MCKWVLPKDRVERGVGELIVKRQRGRVHHSESCAHIGEEWSGKVLSELLGPSETWHVEGSRGPRDGCDEGI